MFNLTFVSLFTQVTCPGTLHLNDRNLVFITVSVFGQTKRTKSTFASFPFEFRDKLYFERVSKCTSFKV